MQYYRLFSLDEDHIGFKTYYNAKAKEISVHSLKTRLVVKLGTTTALVNGKKLKMPFPLRNEKGTVRVSADFLANVFPADITEYEGYYEILLRECNINTVIGGEQFILHVQSGDFYIRTAQMNYTVPLMLETAKRFSNTKRRSTNITGFINITVKSYLNK